MVHWIFKNAGLDPYQAARFNSAHEFVEDPGVHLWLIALDVIVLGLAGSINAARLTKDLLQHGTKTFSFSRTAWWNLSTEEGARDILQEDMAEFLEMDENPRYTAHQWIEDHEVSFEDLDGNKVDYTLRSHFDQLLGKDPDKASDAKWSPLVEEVAESSWRKRLKDYVPYVWNSYFAVSKGKDKKTNRPIGRSILNCIPSNKRFKRPRPVNICDPPRVAKLVAKKLGPKRTLKGSKKKRKIICVSTDVRHLFHLIPICNFLRNFFWLAFQTKKKCPSSDKEVAEESSVSGSSGQDQAGASGSEGVSGKEEKVTWIRRFARWLHCPMGWAHSPTCAQSLGWHWICCENPVFAKDEMDKHEACPLYLETKDKEGLVFLVYDNVHGYFLNENTAREFICAVRRNYRYYNVTMKYAYLDGKEIHFTDPSEEQIAAAEHPSDLQVSIARLGEMEEVPNALGIEYDFREDRPMRWRIVQEKVQSLPEFTSLPLATPRHIVRVLGKILYRLQLDPGHPNIQPYINLLSKVAQYQYHQGGWDASGFQLSPDERSLLEKGYEGFIYNDWFDGERLEKSRKVIWGATDASKEALAWVAYGDTAATGPPEVPYVQRPTAHAGQGEVWDRQYVTEDKHIFLLEVEAACWYIRTVAGKRTARGTYSNYGKELVVGIDSSATRCAINRGLSANPVAHKMIAEALRCADQCDLMVTAVGVPGIYNYSDQASRPSKYTEFLAGNIEVSLTPAQKARGLKSSFDPWYETWSTMRSEWLGQRLNLAPEEVELSSSQLLHTEYVDDEDDDDQEELVLSAGKRTDQGTSEDAPAPKRRRVD